MKSGKVGAINCRLVCNSVDEPEDSNFSNFIKALPHSFDIAYGKDPGISQMREKGRKLIVVKSN